MSTDTTNVAHTPGPWTLAECSHGGGILKRGADHPQSHLQIVPLADARLIAAAPDLLAALKTLKRRIHFVGMPQEKRNSDGRPDWSDEIALLEAAIAKAEGR